MATVPYQTVKVKLSPKYNLGFCQCIWVKPLCKSIITTKEALSSAIFLFSAQTHFQWECMGRFYASIKIAVLKTLRRLDTTRNFTSSITRASTHSSADPDTVYPEVSILEYVWAAMTTRGRRYCQPELFKNFHFNKLCGHKQCSQCSCSCVETLVILWAKFHVVSSLLSVLKIVILKPA